MAKYKVDIPGIDTNNLKVLSNKEIIALFEKFKSGNESVKDEIVNGNLKLVLSIINKYTFILFNYIYRIIYYYRVYR